MKPTNEISVSRKGLDVEALKSRLRQQMIITPRFRWPLTLEQANALLLASYSIQVEARGNTFTLDDATTTNIQHVAEALFVDHAKNGAMFCGLCGNGKTTMIHAIQLATNYLVKHKAMDSELGMQIVDAREVTVMRSKDYPKFVKVKDHKALAVDDLGTEPVEVLDFGNVLSPLVELIEHRYAKQLFTILTTNLTPSDIKPKYGQRIADRFNEMLRVVVFENKSYRK